MSHPLPPQTASLPLREPDAKARPLFTLGINASFHDSAAALLRDGEVLAASEEERFTRIKHGKRPVPFTAWELPYHAINDCLKQAGITLAEVSHVAYSFDPHHFIGQRAPDQRFTLPLRPSDFDRGDWENPWDPLFAAYILNAPRQLTDGVPHHLKKRFDGVQHHRAPYRWHFVPHHLCHQASAFLAAPFSSCAVMTLDGRGEHASTCYGRYRNNRYDALGEVRVPHSLGLLYEQVTAYLGFLHSSDEYKVMALAALGTPRHAALLKSHVQVMPDGRYEIHPLDLEKTFGPRRVSGGPMSEHYLDLAASLQEVLEDTVLQLAGWLREASGEDRLAMAGGVALNCVMNARLRDAGIFREVWVQPAAGDAGTALGAALWVDARERRQADSAHAPAEPPARPEEAVAAATLSTASGGKAEVEGPLTGERGSFALAPRVWSMQHAYLGPAFTDEEIEALLQWAQLDYRRSDDVAEDTARLLADNKIIGWFQGRMEFGPRALGARSLLASPVDPAMQARLNELKDREDFRPVAPAVNREDLADWFEPAQANQGESPFMLFVYRVKPGRSERIPSALHTDRTARVQTVDGATNPIFHDLLAAVGRHTGVPVLVNTSFNVRGEPIVGSPKAALEAFFSTPLDALVIGSFILEKPKRGGT
ncbi:carbamoyltransferase family protein [Roseateles depolymerans]|uniref:Carbamoyltransferase n=1 Tax=Roseateles depolymerans TaxID=76731 RepID=A0A0U3MX50_9BURK|nr:carbamoyltransferase C-terminal domain-containing protein [Roseateles depolymerans]ALV06500.1 carbamoyltransferase [Roseateles depolymerans]REG19475.1 carbamoyltransferase [Roseateles depolymerans]